MHLAAYGELGPGRIVTTMSTLTRPDGSLITVPVPMYLLEQNMGVVADPRVNELDQIVTDLDRWHLRDLSRNRATGLVVTGRPDTDSVSRLVQRYLREARDLPQHELTDWTERVVGDLRTGS